MIPFSQLRLCSLSFSQDWDLTCVVKWLNSLIFNDLFVCLSNRKTLNYTRCLFFPWPAGRLGIWLQFWPHAAANKALAIPAPCVCLCIGAGGQQLELHRKQAKEVGDNRRKMITHGIAGGMNWGMITVTCKVLKNIYIIKQEWVSRGADLFTQWIGCSQPKAQLVFLKFRFGFCLLLLLDALDSVTKTELLKSLEELR